jgi:hypothetical protein
VSVTPLMRSHRNTVDMLRELLESAERGELLSAMVIAEGADYYLFHWSGEASITERVGRLERLKYHYLNGSNK